jgi:hypothetical protein
MDYKDCKRIKEEKIGRDTCKASALRSPAVSCPACLSRRGKRGQQVLEYAILVSVLISVFFTMYMYGRRGVQAVIKGAADQMGPQEDSQPPAGTVFTNALSTVSTVSSDNVRINKTGYQSRSDYDSVALSEGNTVSHTESY